MKMKTKLALVVGVATLAVTPVFAKGGSKQVTDMTHVSYRVAMTNDGVEPSATGTITVSAAVQGSANKQKLTLAVSGLTGGATYSLMATLNDGSATTVDLDDFPVDNKGHATVSLSNSGKSGKHGTPLPDGFDLSQVIEFDVIDSTSTPVLTADTTAPASLKYMAKRNLNNGGSANGTVQISSSKGKTKFSLTASGLDAGTDYQIVFNGTPVETVTTDAKGNLKNTDAPLPANILDLQTVEVWDASNTAVLGTTTPLP
jgi:hypothetical protein